MTTTDHSINSRTISLPNGEEIVITFTDEGVVYDRLDRHGELIEAYGYDFYWEIKPLQPQLNNYEI